MKRICSIPHRDPSTSHMGYGMQLIPACKGSGLQLWATLFQLSATLGCGGAFVLPTWFSRRAPRVCKIIGCGVQLMASCCSSFWQEKLAINAQLL